VEIETDRMLINWYSHIAERRREA